MPTLDDNTMLFEDGRHGPALVCPKTSIKDAATKRFGAIILRTCEEVWNEQKVTATAIILSDFKLPNNSGIDYWKLSNLVSDNIF
jgi:predicted alpha-1,6-mannanase (GH76 family)